MVKKWFFVGLIALLGSPCVGAAIIPGLYNTGVDGAGVALAGGANDPHYLVGGVAPAVTVDNPGDAGTGGIPATWVDNNLVADPGTDYRWVWATPLGQPTFVSLLFRFTFDLTGLDPSTANISGTWSTDNFGDDILINGATTGNTCTGFSFFCPFTVSSGFQPGLNTLDFVVSDVGVIAGFLVASISGSAAVTGTAVPEPGTLALLAASLVALRVARRRKNI